MSMISLCGNNCKYCPRYIATQKGSMADLEKVKQLWVRLELRAIDFPVKDMACHGCKPENKCAYPEILTCVVAKTHDNCGLCDEYPCKLINSVFDKSERLKCFAEKKCAPEEMSNLQKAFFSKKKNFGHIYNNH